jgi:hypothetical protein
VAIPRFAGRAPLTSQRRSAAGSLQSQLPLTLQRPPAFSF